MGPFRYVVLAPRYVIRRAAGLWGGQTIHSDWDLVKYGRVYNLSVEKARLTLGYVPRVSREQGMRETQQWMTDQVQIR